MARNINKTIEQLNSWKNEILFRGTGTISDACDIMAMSRNTYYSFINEGTAYWPEFAEMIPMAIEEQRQRRIDEAEEQMFRMVKDGNFAAVKFVLERLGKDRGWGNYQDVKLGGESKSIEIKFD